MVPEPSGVKAIAKLEQTARTNLRHADLSAGIDMVSRRDMQTHIVVIQDGRPIQGHHIFVQSIASVARE